MKKINTMKSELVKMLTPDFSFNDERGNFTQIVHDGYKQVNVIFTRKGVVRGGHFHKINTELFYVVSGSFDLILKKDGEQKTVHFQKGNMFSIPPFVLHSFRYTEDTVKVSMYDRGVELPDNTKDIYKAEF